MSVLIKNMEMPKGCIYANDNDQTEYCPLLNHDDVPFCQYIESEPEIAIGIDERPVYCPLSDVPEPCENTVSRQAAIDAMEESKRIYVDRRVIIGKMQDIVSNLPSAQLYTEEQIQTMQDLESAEIEKTYELGRESAQQWIPCSERLPEHDGEKYLVTLYSDRINVVSVRISYCYMNRDGFWSDVPVGYKVTAWMPLPEPWMGEQSC